MIADFVKLSVRHGGQYAAMRPEGPFLVRRYGDRGWVSAQLNNLLIEYQSEKM